jgi:PrtD family type I secretion system ABC transporter
MIFTGGSSIHPDVAAAMRDCRRALASVAVFSGVVNLLMLAGPLYMLQIYDRVLSSRSVPTLIALSIFLVGAYAFQGALDLIRSRVVVRSAALLDQHLALTVHGAVIRFAVATRHPGEGPQPVRDLDQIRTFLTGAGPTAIVDLPWIPMFLTICFLIHLWLGLAATAGGIILFTMTLLTERISRAPARASAQEAGLRSVMVESQRRNGETIVAMGMTGALGQRWAAVNDRYIATVAGLSDTASSFGSVSKVLRLLLQSMMLGLGAYLVIKGELTAGAMIAASIMMGRALAPIDTAIANWRAFIAARQSIKRLSEALGRADPKRAATSLPKPGRSLDVEQVTVVPPGGTTPIVAGVRFGLKAGQALGIIGPSGAGKTSLVRTLVGIWRPAKGGVRLDGAALDQWDPEVLGRHLGFISQTVELFDGTIAENIARMSIKPDADAVLRAARAAGAHEIILRFPSGYDTRIGEGGAVLSAGQRQRVALARALYGDPFLVVLDEPNSNLDNEGDAALRQAILDLKSRRAIVVLIAHRPSMLADCDHVLLLANGAQQDFGPRDEILRKVISRRTPAVASATAAAAAVHNLKVVSDTTNELLRSPYEPRRAYERSGPERYIENDRDLLRSSFAPERSRTQATVDAGVPAGEDAAPREGYKPHLFSPSEPERLRPPPAMTRRDKLRRPLVGVLIAAMLAAPIGYYIAVEGGGPSSEPPPGAQMAMGPIINVPPASTVQQEPRLTTTRDDDRGTSAQSEIASKRTEPPRPERSSEDDAAAMVQPSAAGAQAAPGSKGTRVLDPEEIKLFMKQGEQFIAAGDVVTARTVLRRAVEAGDANAAMALGATYDPTVLAKLGVVGMDADVEKARSWYQTAEKLGSPEARRRLDVLADR